MSNFAIDVLGPVVILIAFGYFLFKRRLVTDDFVEIASGLIFNFALPALLFINISNADLANLLDVKSISVGISATLIIFIISLIFVSFFIQNRADRGVMVQGIFRANMGIIGLAYCAKAYGPNGLAFASVYMGCLTIVYNVLSVGVLNLFQNQSTDLKRISKGIATNPIIMSIVAGMLFSHYQWSLPGIIDTSLGYFAQLTLPLALVCTGAALRFHALGEFWGLTLIAIIGKCVVYPLTLISLALVFDIQGMTLGILFLMAVSPTAAASYIMVRKIGGNHRLAAQIIALSTVISLPITILGFTLLSNIAPLGI